MFTSAASEEEDVEPVEPSLLI